MEFITALTGAATSVGVLLIVVLALAPALLGLWELTAHRGTRREARRTAASRRSDDYDRAA